MKRLLVVSYYFPPSGGPGVQRILKFVRYLPEFGWLPTVVTVDPKYASYPAIDETLHREVPSEVQIIRTRSWDPYSLYARLHGKSKESVVGVGFVRDEADSGIQILARWLRGNVFLPDARRGWVRYAAKAAIDALDRAAYDAVLTSGPPHSTHLVGLRLQRAHALPWVVDMRDPWTEISYAHDMYQSKLAEALQARMERRVLSRADVVVSVSDHVGSLLKRRGAIRQYHTIMNGFDPADIPASPPVTGSEEPFVIAHVGTFNWPKHAPGLVAALTHLTPQAQIHFVGHVQARVLRAFKDVGISPKVVPYLTHSEAVAYMQGADLLLVSIDNVPDNQGIVTGKAFEYVSLGRPVLGIGPVEGDLATILTRTGAGRMFDYDDAQGIGAHIREKMRCRGEPVSVNREALRSYERRELTRDLANILNGLPAQ